MAQYTAISSVGSRHLDREVFCRRVARRVARFRPGSSEGILMLGEPRLTALFERVFCHRLSSLGDGRSGRIAIGSRARRILVRIERVARLSIGPSEGVLVPGESRLGFIEVVSQCRGFGRLVQPRGVAFLGGVLLPGGPRKLVALLLFVLLLR
jgi:hypothetical protein